MFETIIVLFILSFAANIVLVIALKKSFNRSDIFEKHIVRIAELLSFVQARLLHLDRKGTFASDDEIGFAYTTIKALWKVLIEAGLRIEGEGGELEEPKESDFKIPESEKVIWGTSEGEKERK